MSKNNVCSNKESQESNICTGILAIMEEPLLQVSIPFGQSFNTNVTVTNVFQHTLPHNKNVLIDQTNPKRNTRNIFRSKTYNHYADDSNLMYKSLSQKFVTEAFNNKLKAVFKNCKSIKNNKDLYNLITEKLHSSTDVKKDERNIKKIIGILFDQTKEKNGVEHSNLYNTISRMAAQIEYNDNIKRTHRETFKGSQTKPSNFSIKNNITHVNHQFDKASILTRKNTEVQIYLKLQYNRQTLKLYKIHLLL